MTLSFITVVAHQQRRYMHWSIGIGIDFDLPITNDAVIDLRLRRLVRWCGCPADWLSTVQSQCEMIFQISQEKTLITLTRCNAQTTVQLYFGLLQFCPMSMCQHRIARSIGGEYAITRAPS